MSKMNMIQKQVFLNQLASMRSQIDAMMTLLVEDIDEETTTCPHPEDKRQSLSSFGKTHWICQECGYEYKEE